jgi:RNA polymerase sigma factor (sigma-70 family)
MVNNVELKEIFDGLKNKNENSFKDLYEKYNKLIFGIAFSICKSNSDSEDITQNVLLKIYSLDASKLPVSNEASWLYTLSKNETISFLRKKHNNINIDDIYEIGNDCNDINDIVDKQTFKNLIKGLNNKEKEIMSLKILADLSFKEISKILEEPVSTVKWRYYKSINSIKLCLANIAMTIIAFIIGINISSKKNSVSYQSAKSATLKQNSNSGATQSSVEDYADSFTDNISAETIQSSDVQANEVNYSKLTCIGLSIIFLICAIVSMIFFKKYQLKLKRKTSK